ncbi:hypothetical protein V3C99_006519, partial [Haemonchus contortus]
MYFEKFPCDGWIVFFHISAHHPYVMHSNWRVLQ